MINNLIEEKFARAKEVKANVYDLASSLAIVIWREMNNWQTSPWRTDADFIRLHAGSKTIQEEISIMTRGIGLILEMEKEQCAVVAEKTGQANALDEWEYKDIAAAIRASDGG